MPSTRDGCEISSLVALSGVHQSLQRPKPFTRHYICLPYFRRFCSKPVSECVAHVRGREEGYVGCECRPDAERFGPCGRRSGYTATDAGVSDGGTAVEQLTKVGALSLGGGANTARSPRAGLFRSVPMFYPALHDAVPALFCGRNCFADAHCDTPRSARIASRSRNTHYQRRRWERIGSWWTRWGW